MNRYTALSFRNSEELTNSNWNMRSRLAPLRNRRDTHNKHDIILDASSSTIDDTINTAVVPTQQSTDADTGDGMQRARRDTPGCVVNYESNRQLLVGCVQTSVIEVKPHCNDDGDEGNFLFFPPSLITICNAAGFRFSETIWLWNEIFFIYNFVYILI